MKSNITADPLSKGKSGLREEGRGEGGEWERDPESRGERGEVKGQRR